MVEGFFSLTRRRLKRGSFSGIVDLQVAINRYIVEHNDRPKPFISSLKTLTLLKNNDFIACPKYGDIDIQKIFWFRQICLSIECLIYNFVFKTMSFDIVVSSSF